MCVEQGIRVAQRTVSSAGTWSSPLSQIRCCQLDWYCVEIYDFYATPVSITYQRTFGIQGELTARNLRPNIKHKAIIAQARASRPIARLQLQQSLQREPDNKVISIRTIERVRNIIPQRIISVDRSAPVRIGTRISDLARGRAHSIRTSVERSRGLRVG